MNPSIDRILPSAPPGAVSLLCLGLAALSSACSGDYLLGAATTTGDLVSEGATAQGPQGDVRLGALLGAPDVTLSGEYPFALGSYAPVGDLDGDGYDDLVTSGVDSGNEVAFMHVRYGGPRAGDASEAFRFDESGARLFFPETTFWSGVADGVGDVDGDGYDDVLIRGGECEPTVSLAREGAFLLYGGPERLNGVVPITSVAAHFVLPERIASDERGIVCSVDVGGTAADDIDGDGFDDFVLTTSPNRLPATMLPTDGVYAFYGGPQRFSGEIPYTRASAFFHGPGRILPAPIRDVDGDGLSDLLIGSSRESLAEVYFVPGRPQRWSGSIDVTSSATRIAATFTPDSWVVPGLGDIDGDGLGDLLLQDENATYRVVYGAPGLFANGFDLAQAAALDDAGVILPAGDLDADGDDDLVVLLQAQEGDLGLPLALMSGSRERLTGTVSFAEQALAQPPAGRFRNPARLLEIAARAGDLDGDGAADLLSLSSLMFANEDGGSSSGSPMLHLHYGDAASPAPPLR